MKRAKAGTVGGVRVDSHREEKPNTSDVARKCCFSQEVRAGRVRFHPHAAREADAAPAEPSEVPGGAPFSNPSR